jgi:hypothetical protein
MIINGKMVLVPIEKHTKGKQESSFELKALEKHLKKYEIDIVFYNPPNFYSICKLFANGQGAEIVIPLSWTDIMMLRYNRNYWLGPKHVV